MYPRDMVCFGYVIANIVRKGDNMDIIIIIIIIIIATTATATTIEFSPFLFSCDYLPTNSGFILLLVCSR
jgi:hypothetical protein